MSQQFLASPDEGGHVVPGAPGWGKHLIINPEACADVLVDAALSRMTRAHSMVAPFAAINGDALTEVQPEEWAALLSAVQAATNEARTLLMAAIDAQAAERKKKGVKA